MIVSNIIYAGAGYVIGAFTPAVLRKIKSAFSAEVKKADGYVSAEVGKVEKDVKAKL